MLSTGPGTQEVGAPVFVALVLLIIVVVIVLLIIIKQGEMGLCNRKEEINV